MTGVVEVLAVAGSAMAAASPYVAAAAAVAGAGLTYAQSERQAQAMKDQAKQQDFAAQQAALAGRSQANGINAALRATLASQRARYAAAGVTLEGTPDTVAAASAAEAERQTALARGNATIAAEQRRIQGTSLLDEAGRTSAAGTVNLGLSLFGTMDRSLARTPGTVTTGNSGSNASRTRTAAQQADYALGPLY